MFLVYCFWSGSTSPGLPCADEVVRTFLKNIIEGSESDEGEHPVSDGDFPNKSHYVRKDPCGSRWQQSARFATLFAHGHLGYALLYTKTVINSPG
jgi:hypothetical protein